VNRQPESQNHLDVANESSTRSYRTHRACPPEFSRALLRSITIVNESSQRPRLPCIGIFALASILCCPARIGELFAGGRASSYRSLCVNLIVVKMTKSAFFNMIFGGLAAAVGLVIDDAIVVSKNCHAPRCGRADFQQSRAPCGTNYRNRMTYPSRLFPIISINRSNGTFFSRPRRTMERFLANSPFWPDLDAHHAVSYLVRRKDAHRRWAGIRW